jgi:Tol biopolymer transport system component
MLTYLSQPGARPVYMSPPSGGEGIRVSGASAGGNAPSWSPDGKTLAYVAREPGGACRIMVVVLKEGRAKEAGRCKAAETSSLAWQPGTSFLYFADQTEKSGNAIFRLDLRNGQEKRMTGDKQADAWR